MEKENSPEWILLKRLQLVSDHLETNKAWEEVYRMYRGIYAWQAFRDGLDLDAGKDVFQEMMLAFYEVLALEKFRATDSQGDRPISGYLYAIYKNLKAEWINRRSSKLTEALDLRHLQIKDYGSYWYSRPHLGELATIRSTMKAFFEWEGSLRSGDRELCKNVLGLPSHERQEKSPEVTDEVQSFWEEKMKKWSKRCKYKFMRFLFEQKQWEVLLQAMEMVHGDSTNQLYSQVILMRDNFDDIIKYCRRRKAKLAYPQFEAKMKLDPALDAVAKRIYQWRKKGPGALSSQEQAVKNLILRLVEQPPSDLEMAQLQALESAGWRDHSLDSNLSHLHLISSGLDEYFLGYLQLISDFEGQVPILTQVTYDPQKTRSLMRQLGLDKVEQAMFE